MTTGCCWPLLPVRPPRDGAFFARSPAGVNGATLPEIPRRRVVGWAFAVTSRLFFQSRGLVGDDGNGRGSVLVNSLESLGFLSVFKAYHQIVSVPEDNDDREVRISFSK